MAEPTDTERLDYLTQTLQPLYTIVTQQLEPRTDGGNGYDLRVHVEGWVVGSHTGEHGTPRDAIDAAMLLQNI